ncbi:hypothetical protein [Microvirga roseola]|uniref:hypothetical protein n=1 Tax=Microvirga roseola TaxID=2883126 RepID=UPI001E4FCF60|nr:hypothetical protein [Microvirga roseola]
MSSSATTLAGQKRLAELFGKTRLIGAVTLLTALVPIIATSGVFFVDIPNHLFRISLVSRIFHQGWEPQFFQLREALYPNMAMDVATGLLTTIISPSAALLTFLCGTVVLYFASTVYWRRSLGQKTDAPIYIFILLILYSEPLYWGLINYLFGLALMHFGMASLMRQESHPSRLFPTTQALLLTVLCLSSIFPVLLYIAFCAGMALESLRSASGSERITVLARLIRQHLPSAVVVIALVGIMDPGQAGATEWNFWRKFTGLFSTAKTTPVLPEYLLSIVVLCCLIWLVRQRGLIASRPARAGLLACCLLYLVLPDQLQSVHLVDRRLVPAIAGFVLVLIRDAKPGATCSPVPLIRCLSLVIGIKTVVLVQVWSPLAEIQASYRTIAAAIPSGASVIFVPPLDKEQEGAIVRTQSYLKHLLHLEPTSPATAHLNVHYFHLYLAELSGKDINSPQVFTNLAVKIRTESFALPDLVMARDLEDLSSRLQLSHLGPETYAISHVALENFLPSRVSADVLVRSGTVTLYLVRPDEPDYMSNAAPPTSP